MHALFISHSVQVHRPYDFISSDARRQWRQHNSNASSPSCAGAQASFCTVCCCSTTTTHDYASNKPSCASAQALHLACHHQDNMTINYDVMTIQPTTFLCASAWTNSHHAQLHELYSASLHHTMVTTMTKAATTTGQCQGPWCKPEAFTSRRMTGTTTTMAMTMTNVNNEALCPVKRTASSYHVAQRQRQQQQSATTNNKCRTTRPCAWAHNIFTLHHEQQWQQRQQTSKTTNS